MRQVFFLQLQRRDGHDCNHNAELVEGAAALRNLLLAGSGCLEFQKGMSGMDSLNKHVEQISFRQCLTCFEHRQLKGWQPHFQPTVAKSLINLNNCSLVCSSHIAQVRAQSLHCNKSWRKQLRDKTLCFSACDWFFFAAATKGWAWCCQNAELVERTATPRNLLLAGSDGSGCFEFHKRMAGMDSLNKHVEHISFRQYLTFCVHRQLKGWQPHCQPTVAKNSISTIAHWFAAVR